MSDSFCALCLLPYLSVCPSVCTSLHPSATLHVSAYIPVLPSHSCRLVLGPLCRVHCAQLGPATCFAREALELPRSVSMGQPDPCGLCTSVDSGWEACQAPGACLGFSTSLVHFPQFQASSSASRSPPLSLPSATTGAASLLPPSAPSSSVSLPSGTRMKVPQAG